MGPSSGSEPIGGERPSSNATSVGAMSAIDTSPRIRVESDVRMPWYWPPTIAIQYLLVFGCRPGGGSST